MTELRTGTLALMGADLGPENPLPDLGTVNPVGGKVEAEPDVPEEDCRYLGWEVEVSILPHRLQDGYTRKRRPMQLPTIVLENERLHATFLPTLGGRLWSLYDKQLARELLYVNPVFQPANLAVRNAWFSGGVEWNVGIRGHTPYTCSPLFAARVQGEGYPILRLYEWDRIRRVYYQLDTCLPPASPLLHVFVRIRNPREIQIPMYWWSNAAVTETQDLRIITPANYAYKMAYDGRMARATLPEWGGYDITRPTRAPSASDAFFVVDEPTRPFVAAVYEDGSATFQASTPRLKGRKLFVWGMGAGGRRWQEFLSQPGQAYVEIQAGLARTQYECIPMPASADWSWLEVYGPLQCDTKATHGPDWQQARREVANRIDTLAPASYLQQAYDKALVASDAAPHDLLHLGSGWGALEEMRAAGESASRLAHSQVNALPFPQSSLTDEQQPWVRLLQEGALAEPDPSDGPGAFMVQEEWMQLLAQSLGRGCGDHWASRWHLGLMHYHAGQMGDAEREWQTSAARHPNGWALRCLAKLLLRRGELDKGADMMLQAVELLPNLTPLAIECCDALLVADRPKDALRFATSLELPMRSHGRIRVSEAKAALALGNLDAAEEALAGEMDLGDLREGDSILTDLWFELQERRAGSLVGRPLSEKERAQVRRDHPPPPHLDFRMHVAPERV
ncbi:MAG: DUF5107 domain-containing protein [Fimbriimonadia bacterium]|jgi:hypothetical protein